MYTVVLALHVILAALLVGLVLLQQGKGADVGAVMGGGGANSLFGVSGASNLLVRMTTGIAMAFMVTSVLLVKFAASGTGIRGSAGSGVPSDPLKGSVLEGLAVPAQVSSAASQSSAAAAPVAPVAPAAAAPAEGAATVVAPTAAASAASSVSSVQAQSSSLQGEHK